MHGLPLGAIIKRMNQKARISFFLNSSSSKAVIFRRGPSKWTQLLLWDLDNTQIQEGQWFKGRVYLEKSDFSPNGDYLALALAKYPNKNNEGEKNYSWLSISKPPYFSALLTLISKDGQTCGGYFADDKKLIYNGSQDFLEKKDNKKNHGFHIVFKNKNSPMKIYGENPLNNKRLERNGWITIQDWEGTYHKTKLPQIKEKRITSNSSIIMERSVNDFERYTKYSLITSYGKKEIENAECVDFDFKHNLIVSKGGKLYRTKNYEYNRLKIDLELIADLNKNSPSELLPPKNYFE
jgi:hypothetical protein